MDFCRTGSEKSVFVVLLGMYGAPYSGVACSNYYEKHLRIARAGRACVPEDTDGHFVLRPDADGPGNRFSDLGVQMAHAPFPEPCGIDP
jgi:hypothetical protein